MTSKRNSRVFDDDIPRRNRGQSSAMASLDASRRTSRTSSIEDMYTAMAGSTTTKNDDEERKKPAMYEIGSFPKLFDLDTGSEMATTALPVDTESTKSAPSSVTSSSGASSAILTDSGRMANFGVVVPGVYRSSYPLIEHFDFCQSLGLRTVVTLVNKSDERGVNLGAFVQANGIRHVMFDMQGTKKEDIPHHTMQSILEIVHDKSSHPLLIHCNQGKHRTGCVVAAARKVAGWPIDTVLHEYRTFAEPKVRDCDVAYISALEVSSLQPSKAEFGSNSASFTASYRTMRRRVFFRLFAVTSITMLVFMCTSWQWKFA